MTTTYTFEQLKEDVRKEAQALREHATSEERGRVTLDELDPNDSERCYYGLMTGECDSPRACELIERCAPIYVHNSSMGLRMNTEKKFSIYHWSPIEWYITLPEANNANLIAFLRGETNDLDL